MSNTFNFSVWMPEDLGDEIYNLSKSNKRPMNTTIVILLEKALKEKKRKQKSNAKNLHIQDNSSN